MMNALIFFIFDGFEVNKKPDWKNRIIASRRASGKKTEDEPLKRCKTDLPLVL